MGNYTIFFRCSKILGEAGKQEILQQMFRNSRSQIVFGTDTLRKLTLGAPGNWPIALRKFIEAITCTLKVFFSKGIASLIRQKMILYQLQLINLL